ncbi:MAG: 2-oxoacid:acceptor oxidoreductase subunit alpha [bacterium]
MKNTPEQQPLDAFQFKIGGEAGFGVMVIGQMFAKLCSRSGRWAFEYPEYPSLISGGHNSYQVAVGEKPLHAPLRDVHLLVALDQATIALHRQELVPGAGILFDPDEPGLHLDGLKEEGYRLYPVPIERLALEAGSERTRNVVAFAACAGILNADQDLLELLIRDTFRGKGAALEQDLAAANLGYAYAEEKCSHDFPWILPRKKTARRINVTGNTAIALGAIQAGCKLYAAYPMTPSTSILSYLAKVSEQHGMVVRHAEDEIGVINSAIGAAYTGVRSMVGTSGGGFALMTEGVGLAAMLEVPIVIVEAQRPGPSTGLPTWTGQADLQFVLHSSQGEFPRILLAPGDAHECFYLTFQAFNLAERYQLPVFILTDKFLAESAATNDPFSTAHLRIQRGEVVLAPKEHANGMFPRYRDTPTGVSPRTLPGTEGGVHIANSDEHDLYGFSDESAENRIRMTEKRMRKLRTIAEEIPPPILYGPHQADLTLITWGSTKGPALDALALLQRDGRSVNLLHFSFLYPLPIKNVERLLHSTTATMVIEGNATGQFAQLLKEQVGLLPDTSLRKFDGRPFFPSDIVAAAEHFLTKRR